MSSIQLLPDSAFVLDYSLERPYISINTAGLFCVETVRIVPIGKTQKYRQPKKAGKKKNQSSTHLSAHHHFDKASQQLSIFLKSPFLFKGTPVWRHVSRRGNSIDESGNVEKDHAFDTTT